MDDLSRRKTPVAFDWLNGDVSELRERYERAYAVADGGAFEWGTVEDGGRSLRVLIQHPEALRESGTSIVYFHGGGWIVGSPSTHADISRALCEKTGLRLISVDYRLAPEFVAPAPVEDGLKALRWLLSNSDGKLRATNAILCGDSAGGAIALGVERAADPALRKLILGVASLYGAFGLLDSKSLRAKGRGEDGMDRASIARYWSLAHAPGVPSPYAVVALAAASPVPAYLLAASEDPVLDDTLALAAAFEACGRPHVLDVVEGADHGFLHEAGASSAASAASDRLSTWIRELADHPQASARSQAARMRSADGR